MKTRTKIKLAGIAICLMAGIYGMTQQKNELPISLTENIEALASGEYHPINCYGYGSVDCFGYWVKMRIEGLSLE